MSALAGHIWLIVCLFMAGVCLFYNVNVVDNVAPQVISGVNNSLSTMQMGSGVLPGGDEADGLNWDSNVISQASTIPFQLDLARLWGAGGMILLGIVGWYLEVIAPGRG